MKLLLHDCGDCEASIVDVARKHVGGHIRRVDRWRWEVWAFSIARCAIDEFMSEAQNHGWFKRILDAAIYLSCELRDIRTAMANFVHCLDGERCADTDEGASSSPSPPKSPLGISAGDSAAGAAVPTAAIPSSVPFEAKRAASDYCLSRVPAADLSCVATSPTVAVATPLRPAFAQHSTCVPDASRADAFSHLAAPATGPVDWMGGICGLRRESDTHVSLSGGVARVRHIVVETHVSFPVHGFHAASSGACAASVPPFHTPSAFVA